LRWSNHPNLKQTMAPWVFPSDPGWAQIWISKNLWPFFTIQSNQVKNHSAPMNWAGISPSFPQTPNAGCCSALPVRVMGWWWEDCYSLNSDNYTYVYIYIINYIINYIKIT
jgi:hypothetical protein